MKPLLAYYNQDKWEKAVMHTSECIFIPQATEIQKLLNVHWYSHLNECKLSKISAQCIFNNQASFWDFYLRGVLHFYIVVYNIRCSVTGPMGMAQNCIRQALILWNISSPRWWSNTRTVFLERYPNLSV